MKTNPDNLIVLFEDNHLIIINKRVGDIVQGDKTGDPPLSEIIKTYIKKKYNKPGEVFLGVVHRIDRPTSGTVIFAKTSKALERMNKMFREKKVDKIYWAIVKNLPTESSGTLKHYLRKNPKNNKSTVYPKPTKDSKEAILFYRHIQSLTRYNVLEIGLETGRHHQIRAQLGAIKCPIKGDLKYGFDRSNPDGGICLHARKISFVHPVKKEEVTIIAKPPSSPVWDAVSV